MGLPFKAARDATMSYEQHAPLPHHFGFHRNDANRRLTDVHGKFVEELSSHLSQIRGLF